MLSSGLKAHLHTLRKIVNDSHTFLLGDLPDLSCDCCIAVLRVTYVWSRCSGLRYHKPSRSFRTGFVYNNFMYALAGYVAERLRATSWEQLVRQRIFGPLLMTHSKFVGDISRDDDITSSYAFVGGRTEKVDLKLLE